MNLKSYCDEILLKMGQGVLDIEIANNGMIERIVNMAFGEIREYISTSVIITVPYQDIIDTKPYKMSYVKKVYRPSGAGTFQQSSILADPVWLQSRVIAPTDGIGAIPNDYLTFMMQQKLRNTAFSELTYRYDKDAERLYLRYAGDRQGMITIEYVPRYDDIEQVTSDYWINRLRELAYGLALVTEGTIRRKYAPSNSLYALDGDTMVNEGNEILNREREYLRNNKAVYYPLGGS